MVAKGGDDTLAYSLTGSDAGLFDIDAASGQITVKAGTTLDYETRTTYSVNVVATEQANVNGGVSDDGFAVFSLFASALVGGGGDEVTAASHHDAIIVTIYVTDLGGPDTPDAPAVVQNPGSPMTQLNVSWIEPHSNHPDGVTDYNVRYRVKNTANPNSWISHAFTGKGTSTTLTGLTASTTYEVQVQATDAEGTSSWSDSGEGTTAGPQSNSDPTFPGPATRSIAENSPAGTSVGSAVTAKDSDGDTLTYSLSGTDAGKFAIDASTGQITVGAGTVLDYESGKTTYSVTVGVSDRKNAQGGADTAVDDTIAVTINVTDVYEPPDTPDAPTLVQNAGMPLSQLDGSWTAPDMTGKPPLTKYSLRYREKGVSAWTPLVFMGTGTATALTSLKSGTTYQMQVKAWNDEGSSGWSASGEGTTALPPTPTPTPTDVTPPILPPTAPNPSPPYVPAPNPPTGDYACATAHDFGKILHLDRHDGGADLDIEIGTLRADGSIEVKGFIRDGALGQTYSVVRYEGDGRVVRVWVDPDDPLIFEIPWPIVNTRFTVPVCVVVAIQMDERFPAVGQMVRLYDGSDDRIFRFTESMEWQYIPDEGTFQSMGLYGCNVTAADDEWFDWIDIGNPLASSGAQPQDDYASCWVWGETPRSR